MQRYLNLSTRNKLFSAFGLMILFIVTVIFVAYSGLTTMRESQRALLEVELANVTELKDIRANQNANRANVAMMMLSPTKEATQALQADIETRTRETSKELEAITARKGGLQSSQSLFRQFEAAEKETAAVRETQIVPLIRSGKIDEAKALYFGPQGDRDNRLRTMANELVDFSVKAAAQSVERSERAAADAMQLLYGIAGFALLAAIALTLLLARVLAEPLRALSDAAQQVAAGDLRIQLAETTRTDETGVLGKTFRQMVVGMREMMRELGEGVSVLSASANEITASTAQVAASSTQTASAVGETSATAEEVKQTAKLAADKAIHVQETANKTVQISQKGLKAMDDSIQAMHQIQEQMDAIAQSTLRLADQGLAIGEIIATVGDLADQSNVLSVNAAIEAARAGEEGAGFRVVAQEIRSLADQSKQATVQVRALLGDIQKATTSAVMATEQGGKTVRVGVRLAEGAAESIRSMATSIAESADAATQIAASAHQQAVGMDQVAFAMENINQASAQNVAASRQTEAAALDLQALGQNLNP